MITRFAPSLTGYLHLGHVLHMLYVWGIARKTGAKILCRIEDHDLSRARPEYETAILENMEWLGFEPNLGISVKSARKPSEFRQSDNAGYYESVLQTLHKKGLIYGCECSRKQILGNQAEEGELCYSGICADKGLPLASNTVRFRIPQEEVVFADLKLGEQHQIPASQCGDFSLRDRNGQWTYQFACVCDDIRHGVDLVIRGEDILFSTARQILLFQTLGAPIPAYFHHPLICGSDGKKLSKRQRSESISLLRENGATAAQLIGQALFQSALAPNPSPVSAAEAIEKYII